MAEHPFLTTVHSVLHYESSQISLYL